MIPLLGALGGLLSGGAGLFGAMNAKKAMQQQAQLIQAQKAEEQRIRRELENKRNISEARKRELMARHQQIKQDMHEAITRKREMQKEKLKPYYDRQEQKINDPRAYADYLNNLFATTGEQDKMLGDIKKDIHANNLSRKLEGLLPGSGQEEQQQNIADIISKNAMNNFQNNFEQQQDNALSNLENANMDELERIKQQYGVYDDTPDQLSMLMGQDQGDENAYNLNMSGINNQGRLNQDLYQNRLNRGQANQDILNSGGKLFDALSGHESQEEELKRVLGNKMIENEAKRSGEDPIKFKYKKPFNLFEELSKKFKGGQKQNLNLEG